MSTAPARSLSAATRLSSLSTLFALPVVAAELHLPATPEPSHAELRSIEGWAHELLTAREWDSIGHCAERRILDFCAGRACARRALAEFGYAEFELLSGADRRPLWPPALTGSITHTDGFSVAVVGEQRLVAALGIDTERIGAVHPDLWPAICGPVELERLRALEGDAQALAAALTFVAKEAFYKCQYPLAGERFEFGEVRLEEAEWGVAAGSFELAVQRASRLDGFLPRAARRRLRGRFFRQEPYLIAGLALAPI